MLITREAHNRAVETLNSREFLTRHATDPVNFHRTRLEHATVADPAPRFTRVTGNGPVFDPVTKTYTDPKPPKPRSATRPKSFSPQDQWGVSTFFNVYDASNGQHMFKVRGTYRHALREARRFSPHPTDIRPTTGELT